MLDDDRMDQLSLKDRLKKAQYLARELSEHLTQSYLPRLGDLRLVTKEFDPKEVSDQRIFDSATAVLDAEEFTEALYGKLNRYLESIRVEMKPLLVAEIDSDSSSLLRRPTLNVDGIDVFDD